MSTAKYIKFADLHMPIRDSYHLPFIAGEVVSVEPLKSKGDWSYQRITLRDQNGDEITALLNKFHREFTQEYLGAHVRFTSKFYCHEQVWQFAGVSVRVTERHFMRNGVEERPFHLVVTPAASLMFEPPPAPAPVPDFLEGCPDEAPVTELDEQPELRSQPGAWIPSPVLVPSAPDATKRYDDITDSLEMDKWAAAERPVGS